MLKDWLIRTTNREGLFYKSVESLVFSLQKARFELFNGHIIRSDRISSYLSTHPVRKIHFGFGDDFFEGFLNSDIFGDVPIDITKPLPFDDSSVDLIYSSHLIEHIYNRQLKQFLSESNRVLKPGGIHIIATPSLGKIISEYSSHSPDWDLIRYNHARFSNGEPVFISNHLNNLSHINFGHKYLYDASYLSYLSFVSGYSSFDKCPSNYKVDSSIDRYLSTKPKTWDIETETFILRK